MIESNLNEGKQNFRFNNIQSLKYGVGITDSCLGIEMTEMILKKAYNDFNFNKI